MTNRRTFIQKKWLATTIGLLLTVVVTPLFAINSASALDARVKCGSACNNISADAQITLVSADPKVKPKKFVCSSDARMQSSGNPTSKLMGVPGFNDSNLVVKVYYSRTCQTMWASVTNAKAIGRNWFQIMLNSTLSSYNHTYATPAPNQTTVTTMIDDHSPTYGIAAAVDIEESKAGGAYSRYYFSY